MFRKLSLFSGCLAAALSLGLPAQAAELAGVNMPDRMTVDGKTLVLNGMGLRTYSIFDVHIYVAGLYLEQPSHDPDAILDSPGAKMLKLHFVHDVSASQSRTAWRKGLKDNCLDPCTLSPDLMDDFLSHLAPIQAGETVSLLFKSDGHLAAYFDGKENGKIDDPQFVRDMLAVFIGPDPATPNLKRGLLGQ